METLFEEYGFSRLFITNPASLTVYKYFEDYKNEPGVTRAKTCLVVDAGYSFTHIVPYVNGKQVKEGIRRIDVGGKALTNHLKDVISYRQLHVLDETYVMNQCKEDCCFVSQNYMKQLETCKGRFSSSLSQEYVLPDYTVVKRGFIRKIGDRSSSDQQIIKMNNERISIPELLFYPSDCGINQIGVSHAIFHSVESFPEEVKPHLYNNIVLMGGSASFEGFKERVTSDVRSLANTLYEVRVTVNPNPACEAWLGGKMMSRNEDALNAISIDRKLYQESGPSVCIDKLESTKTTSLFL
jgi:actin-related protein 6